MATENDHEEIPQIGDAGSAMEQLMKSFPGKSAEEEAATKAAEEAEALAKAREETKAAAPKEAEAAAAKQTEEAAAKEKEAEAAREKEAKEKETPPKDAFLEEVDAIKPHPHASKKSAEAIETLRGKAKAEHLKAIAAEKAREEAQRASEAVNARIQELESKVVTPEIEKELTELRAFRDTYGLESDPSVTGKFDERVKTASGAINEVMKSIAVPEATQKFIDANGGLFEFRSSSALMPPNLKNKDGSRMTHAQFYKTYIEGHLTDAQKEELSDLFTEIRHANRDKKQAIDNLKTNRESFIKQRGESMKKAQEDWVNRVSKTVETTLAQYGDIAKRKEIPAGATSEQKAEIEKHNARYDKAEAKFKEIMSSVTPENLTQAAIAAGYVDAMKDLVKEKEGVISERDKRIKELEDELTTIKKAGKTSDMRGTAAKGAKLVKTAKSAGEAMTQLVSEGAE